MATNDAFPTRARRRSGLAAVAVALVMALALAACGGSDDSKDSGNANDEAQTGGKVVFGLAGETDGWIPQGNRWGPSAINVARALYDPLAVVDLDGVAKPYLVDRIEPNNDFREWHIYMRDEEITWHNGEPLTPQDIATNLKEQQLSPLAANAFDPIDSVVVQTDSADPNVDWDVQVNLNERWATFPNLLTNQTGYMVYPPTIDDLKAGNEVTPVGTGPFQWRDWVPDDHLTVERWDNYWRTDDNGTQLPYLDEVEFRPIVDPTSRQNALTSGEVDMLITNSAEDVIKANTDPPDDVQVVPDGSAGDEMVILLNTASGVMADLDVRRALALAVDRQAIVDQLYDGYFEIADGPYDDSSQWWADSGWPDPDPEEAKALVDAWEAENGEDLSFEMQIINSQENLNLAQTIQQQAEKVGITIDVTSTDEAQFANSLVSGTFDAIMLPFFNRSDPDAEYHFIDPFRVGAEGEEGGTVILNFPRYTSEVTQEALPAARQTDDPEERAKLYAEVWKDWAKNFPYIFLYHAEWVVEAKDSIHGLEDFTYPDGEPAAPVDWGGIFLTDAWVEQ